MIQWPILRYIPVFAWSNSWKS